MELVCPAGSRAALERAVEAGADAVYLGLRDETNARHFPGLNFDASDLARGVAYAHARGTRVFMAINTYAQAGRVQRWRDAVARAADAGVDVVILADIGLLGWAAERYPDLPRHLSVQASATNLEALRWYHEQFAVRRAVLPRVLSLAQVKALAADSPVEIEVFGFGSLCIMAEGRCALSAHATGQSPNTHGACSPASAVQWIEHGEALDARVGGVLVDRFEPGVRAGYPTLCKGRFVTAGHTYHVFEEPTSLNTLDVLPDLAAAGVAAIKLEGRQRSPAYVGRVTAVWRAAIDDVLRGGDFKVRDAWRRTLAELSEGSQTTLGAYHRPWQ